MYADHGPLLTREAISICFYMRRNHREVARAVQRSLESFVRAVGPNGLNWYTDMEGDPQPLDAAGWKHIQNDLEDPVGTLIHLEERPDAVSDYVFKYYGRHLEEGLNDVCSACFWLPTEYLEAQGPEHVRKLALELAAPLPFNSGHAGLAFNTISRPRNLRQLCFRYPGMDFLDQGLISMNLGTHVRGAYWMTFLGQPVLGELGGAAGLRARLSSPDITVQEMDGERVAITLGAWPEAGDTEAGQDLPLHRELARVLEPWLFHEQARSNPDFPPEDVLRWERRFLD
jgi:hypothetical protein